MSSILCPICKQYNADNLPSSDGGQYYQCPRCGEFITSSSIYKSHLENLKLNQRIYLSGLLANNTRYILHRSELSRINDSIKLPDINEKADLLLLYLAMKYPIPGKDLPISIIGSVVNAGFIQSAMGKCYIIDDDELDFLVNSYLFNELKVIEGDAAKIQISPLGWKYISKIKEKNPDSKTAFIAMWFNEKVIDVRNIIKEAIRDAGFEPKVVDEEEHNDDVTDKIITLIKRSRFVVADFTEQRAGVYYEAGFAKGMNIPVIHTVLNNQIKNLHFDINHQNFIAWDVEKLDEFKEKLTNRITSTIGDGPKK